MISALALTFLFMLGFVLFIWTLYLYSKNASIIDTCWSIGIFLCSTSYLLVQQNLEFLSFKTVISWLLLLLWATRLAGFLWLTRVAKNHRDPRYETLSENWKVSKAIGFLFNYMLQGLLMMVIALPFLFIANNHPPHLLIIDYCAIALIVIALIGEGIADWQLHQFKRNSPGMVCNVGLWNYSRHPNYFFEWLIWFGFCLLGVNSEYGYLSVLSPLLLLVIFVFITGPITEQQSLKSRGAAYKHYQQTTSFIIPWFK